MLDAPPVAHEVAAAPELASLRLVAAPADASLLPRGGCRGFPHWGAWSERGGRFGTDVIRFMAEGAAGPFPPAARRYHARAYAVQSKALGSSAPSLVGLHHALHAIDLERYAAPGADVSDASALINII